jgi:predicted transcriptional regulator
MMNKPYPITELEQFKALTSPVRGEILDIVNLMGPLSITEVAAYTGRPIDSLYYHVRRLVKVGLLVNVAKRKAKRQMEATYDLPGRPMFLQYVPSQLKHVENVIKSIGTMLRVTERNFRNAFEKDLVRVSGRRRNVDHVLVLGWYTEEEIQEIRLQIREIIKKFHSSARHRKKTSELFALTTILTPLEVKRRRKNE